MKEYSKKFSKQQRTENWHCQKCGKLNAFYRYQCRACRKPRGSSTPHLLEVRDGRAI